jgi:hypothetical protein
MTSPLTNAARALSEHLANTGLAFDHGDGLVQTHLFLAELPIEAVRAVVLAIREPSDWMTDVGGNAMAFDCWRHDVDDDWPKPDELGDDERRSWKRTARVGFEAMIDIALAD